MDCENLLIYKKIQEKKKCRCVYGDLGLAVEECSHFKAKPKQDNTIEQAKKSLEKKGQNIECPVNIPDDIEQMNGVEGKPKA